MNKIILIPALIISTTFLLASVAFAVSIDFKTLYAVEIGDLQTVKSDDGHSVEHSIHFSGSQLSLLANLLPSVTSIEDDKPVLVEGMTMLAITNSGEDNITEEDTTAIYLACTTLKDSENTTCSITIIKGIQPG